LTAKKERSASEKACPVLCWKNKRVPSNLTDQLKVGVVQQHFDSRKRKGGGRENAELKKFE